MSSEGPTGWQTGRSVTEHFAVAPPLFRFESSSLPLRLLCQALRGSRSFRFLDTGATGKSEIWPAFPAPRQRHRGVCNGMKEAGMDCTNPA